MARNGNSWLDVCRAEFLLVHAAALIAEEADKRRKNETEAGSAQLFEDGSRHLCKCVAAGQFRVSVMSLGLERPELINYLRRNLPRHDAADHELLGRKIAESCLLIACRLVFPLPEDATAETAGCIEERRRQEMRNSLKVLGYA